MKKFLILLTLLVAGVAQAQTHNQDAGAAIGGTQVLGHTTDGTTAINTSGKWGKFAVSTYGGSFVTAQDPSSGLTQSVIPVSSNPLNGAVTDGIKAGSVMADDTIEAASTRTVLNLTANVAAIGDYIIPTGGTAANLGKWYQVCDKATNTVTLCGTGLDATPSTDTIRIFRYRPLSATGTTADGSAVGLLVSLNRFYQNGNGGDLLKAEDAVHTSGDAGVQPLAVNNRNMASFSGVQLDYIPPAVTDYGSVFSYLVYDDTLGETRGSVTREDMAMPNAVAGVKVLNQALSAIAQSVDTSGDAAPPSMDLGNRLVTTKAPKGEMAEGCNTAVTTNTTGQIFAGVASKFSFVTSWECTNSGAAASFVILEDADGTDLARGYLAANTGYFSAPFPDIPAFSNAVNKAIQVNVLTTGTSTICCARGYYGVL